MAIYDINGNVISAGNAALPFVGKKVVCFGDSIWAYNVGSGKLPEIIQANMGGAWYACAVGGTRMTPTHENDYAMVSATALADAIATDNWTNVNSALNGDTVTNSAVIKNAFSKVQALDFSTDVAMIVFAFSTNDFSSGQAWEDETGKNDDVDMVGGQDFLQAVFKSRLGAAFLLQHHSGIDACLFGPFQGIGVCVVGDHQSDLAGIQDTSLGINQRLQVGATAGDENRDPFHARITFSSFLMMEPMT